MFFFFSLPRFMQAILKKFMRALGNNRSAFVLDQIHEYTRDEIDDALRAKDKIDNDLNERWQTEKLDACISPAYYHSAFKHEDD